MTFLRRSTSTPHQRFAVICLALLSLATTLPRSRAADLPAPPRCQLLPLPGHQLSFTVDGIEKTRWHFGPEYPRPFFYPFNGPSGTSLTRMGHPGAANHDHHRSVWFAHQDVGGVNFWSDQTDARVRQKDWIAYADGDEEAVMATLLGWFDGEGRELMEQELVAALRPRANGGHELEIQITLRPPTKTNAVELGKTNFGFFAVRVAASLSRHFGGGDLTDSEGRVGEKSIFGNTARWMDYTGPVASGTGPDRKTVTEGITCFDHPSNPRHPAPWHVRSDGWMGASFCMHDGLTIHKDTPLTLRYLLSAHTGAHDPAKSEATFKAFAARPGFKAGKSKRKHRQFDVWRTGTPHPDASLQESIPLLRSQER